MTTASEHDTDTPKRGKHAKRARKHADDVPRLADGSPDMVKIKEARREAPGEEPLPPEEREERPAIVYPAPHTPGIKHEAGKDPEEVKAELEAASEDESVTIDTGATNDYAQELYGYRKEGRLYSCRQEGLPTLMIVCDSPAQAREAYVMEAEAEAERRNKQAGVKKGEKGEKAIVPTGGPFSMPAGLPSGTTITLGTGELPTPNKNLVRVRRLVEGMGPPLPAPPRV